LTTPQLGKLELVKIKTQKSFAVLFFILNFAMSYAWTSAGTMNEPLMSMNGFRKRKEMTNNG